MLTVAIRERNSHFVHGLKIIIKRLCQERCESLHFLLPEHHDVADIVFISLDDNWVSAECYKIPQATRTQRIILICRKREHEKLMFRPCLYMLPVIFREDEIDEITRKIAHWIEPARDGKNTCAVPTSICQYCTTRHFTAVERELLKHIACGHSLANAAHFMKIDEKIAELHRQAIMKKLHISDQYKLINFIRKNLLFLMNSGGTLTQH